MPLFIIALAALFVLPILSPVVYVAIGGHEFMLTLGSRTALRFTLDALRYFQR